MPLDAKSREEKEAYARKKMAEMKLKNEKFKERYREVQKDREKAEERNSSITVGLNAKREADREIAPKPKQEREWDRGKPNPNSDDWDSSKHHDYYSGNTRGYSDRRMRNESWRSRSTNISNKPTSTFFSKFQSNKNESSQQSSRYRNDTNHYNNRSRLQFHSSNFTRGNTEGGHQSYQNSKFDDHPKKSSNESFSASPNFNDSKKTPEHHSVTEAMDELMWQCGSMNEVQHKLSRIENWVKSINMNQEFTNTTDALNTKDEYEFQGKSKDLSSSRERPRKYGSNEDFSSSKAKGQTRSRMKEKSEHKFNQTHSNSRGYGNRVSVADRCSLVSDSKNQREGIRKNFNERSKRKCGSDFSDRASSMKESDDVEWGKDRIIQARTSSRNSDHSSIWGGEPGNQNWEEICVKPLGSNSWDNVQSNEFTNLDDAAWKEEIQEESVSKQSKPSSERFPRGNGKQNPYPHGSKSSLSCDRSENNQNKFSERRSKSEGKFSVQPRNTSTSNLNGAVFIDDVQIVEETCNELDLKIISNLKNEGKSDQGLGGLNVPETMHNTDSECPEDNWKDCIDSKKHCITNEYACEIVPKPTGIRFANEQNTDCWEFECHNSKEIVSEKAISGNDELECQINQSIEFVNSRPPADVNCSNNFKKNMENIEVTPLQPKHKESGASRSCRIKGKRNSHKGKLMKMEKPVQKSKVSGNDLKGTGKLIPTKNKIDSKNSDVLYLHTDSELSDDDRHLNVPSSDEKLGEHDVKLVSEEKPILITNVRSLIDETNRGTVNLSDDEWSTVSDEEDPSDVL